MPVKPSAPFRRASAMTGAAALALSLIGCVSQANPPVATTPTEQSPSASPITYVQAEDCTELLGPLEEEFLAEGAIFIPLDEPQPDAIWPRFTDVGGLYCNYAEVFVDGSGRALAAAPLDAASRVEAEAFLSTQGFERTSSGDAVIFRGADSPEQFPSTVHFHVLRADSWIFTTNNWGGQAKQPFADVERWAEQLAELAYTG
jgi:hypothetical protein